MIRKSVKILLTTLWLIFLGGCHESFPDSPGDDTRLLFLKTIDGSASAGIVLDSNYLYLQTSDGPAIGKLYRVSKDGQEIATFDAGGQSFGVPTITSSSVITTSTTAGLMVYDKSSRQLRWSKTGFNWLALATADESKVYVTELNKVQAFDLIDGTPIWQTSVFGKNASNPLIEGNYLYFGTGSILHEPGYFYCINKNDGSVIFQDTLPYVPGNSQFGGTSAGAVIWQNRAFIPCDNRYLYCFDKNDGSLIWKFLADAPMETTPQVKDGMLFFGSLNRTCYAADANSGHLVWSYHGEGSISSVAPSFYSNKVSFTSGSLIVLDRNVGTKLMEYSVNSGRFGFWTAVFDSDGKLYCTGWDENTASHLFLVYQF